MALPSTGPITMDMIRKELNRHTGAISLNDADVRTLAGKHTGTISMSDLRGKEQYGYTITVGHHGDFYGYSISGNPHFGAMVSSSSGFTPNSINASFFTIGNTTTTIFEVSGPTDPSGLVGSRFNIYIDNVFYGSDTMVHIVSHGIASYSVGNGLSVAEKTKIVNYFKTKVNHNVVIALIKH